MSCEWRRVWAGFARGFTNQTVYNHTTEIGLNGARLGGGIVPQHAALTFDVPASLLMLDPAGTAQTVNVRSQHTNEVHYTVATDFELSLSYQPYVTTNCITASGTQGVSDSIGGLNLCPFVTGDDTTCVTSTTADANVRSFPSARANACAILIWAKHAEEIVIVPTSHFAFGGDTDLDGGLLFEQVGGDVTEQGHVVRRVVLA